MERELRRLGKHPQQHQHQNHRVERMGANLLTGGKNISEFVTAHHLTQQQDTGQQRQPPRTSDRQRHAGALARIGGMRPVADQQEGRQAGHLPEHHHQQQVLGQHHAQHRRHEQQQIAEEAPHGVAFGEVITCVKNHQQADALDHQCKKETQPIKAKADI